jgi:hypothetical protein
MAACSITPNWRRTSGSDTLGEDVVEIVRDTAGHLAERIELGGLHELRLRRTHLVVRLTHAVVEARVGDGGRARVGEQRGEFEVVLLERVRMRARQQDRAQRAIPRHERHAQQTRGLERRAHGPHRARVGRGVGHERALRALRDRAGQPLAESQAHRERGRHVVGRVAQHGHEGLLGLVAQEHHAVVGGDHRTDVARDGAQDGVEVERVDDRTAHGEQRAELLALVDLVDQHVLERCVSATQPRTTRDRRERVLDARDRHAGRLPRRDPCGEQTQAGRDRTAIGGGLEPVEQRDALGPGPLGSERTAERARQRTFRGGTRLGDGSRGCG